ncbi:heterokaryon incompatibility protein-domain-containing protein [Nemania sp. FL0031]|nr:heterokaryon incompatibility protein-domain-containing protein [Nemania sp. FL0031]
MSVASSMLCPTCAALPFDVLDPRFGVKYGPPTWKLGTLTQISRRQCIFCKLVTQAVLRIQRTEPEPRFRQISPDQAIEIWALGERYNKPGLYLLFPSLGAPIGTTIGVLRDSQVVNSFYTPISTTQIDFGRVRGWLSRCSLHQPPCQYNFDGKSTLPSLFSGLRTIRFVDVDEYCLVERHNFSRYVALSYVWGTATSFRLTKANKSRLMQPNAIRDVWDLLPKTIQDAITAVRMIGEKYVWVDSLCLVQNDPQDVANGTGVMDLIYEYSTLTIAAAGGRDANDGLPGVYAGSRFVEEHVAEVVPGLRLAVYTNGEYRVEPTVYNSRAWTLQEFALSPRLLCFVDNQVFFRCQRAIYSEDSHDEICPKRSPKAPLHQAMRMKNPAEGYRRVVEPYSARILSFPADVRNAMAGITRRFSSIMKCRFLEGIPTAVFDHFLTFKGARSSLKRRNGFPSYSWTGWIGPLHFWGTNLTNWIPESGFILDTANENEWLYENTWIVWYKRDPSGLTSLVWDVLVDESFPRASVSHPTYRKKKSFASQYHPGFATSRTSPSDITLQPNTIPSYTLLQFWTLSVFYRLFNIDPFRALADLVDRQGTVIGSLSLDSFEETEFFDNTEIFELIVLAKTPWPRNKLSTNASYFVMCLEWKDGTIAERRGMGDISVNINDLRDSFEPGPSWKEIILA